MTKIAHKHYVFYSNAYNYLYVLCWRGSSCHFSADTNFNLIWLINDKNFFGEDSIQGVSALDPY